MINISSHFKSSLFDIVHLRAGEILIWVLRLMSKTGIKIDYLKIKQVDLFSRYDPKYLLKTSTITNNYIKHNRPVEY